METQKPAAGWYPHPTMTDTRQYWDGDRWTDHIAPAQVSGPGHTGLVTAGWILTFLFPLGGLVVGLLLINKRPGHALSMTALSLISIIYIIYFFVSIAAAIPEPCTYDGTYSC